MLKEREEQPVDREETLEFARSLMKEVWEPFDSSAVARFYHQDAVGHHRRPNETQELGYADVVNRIDWDKPTPMASSTIVTSLPKRADTPSGTLTGRTSRPKTRMGCRIGTPLLQGEDRRGDDLLLPPEGGKGGRVLAPGHRRLRLQGQALEPYAREDTKLPSISHKVA